MSSAVECGPLAPLRADPEARRFTAGTGAGDGAAEGVGTTRSALALLSTAADCADRPHRGHPPGLFQEIASAAARLMSASERDGDIADLLAGSCEERLDAGPVDLSGRTGSPAARGGYP